MGVKGQLYTSGDIADLLGVGRQRGYTITRMRNLGDPSKDFPEPFDYWEGGLAVWLVKDVKAWVKTSPYAHRISDDE